VAESTPAGVTAYYVRGDDLLAVLRGTGTRFFHADGLGSIRRLTDEAGSVTDSYEYTAFGELISHVGPDPQPYAFAGEPYDPNVGFQYHRARWTDPGTGRFLATDPHPGDAYDPASLHKYLYAGGDPLNRLDPTGQFSLPELSLGLLIRSVLQTLAISVPLRAYRAAQELKAGNDLGAIAQEAAIGLATDVAVAGLMFGVLQYAPRLVQLATASRAFTRAAHSVWNLDKWARGLEIERRILAAGRWLPERFPVIDDYVRGSGVATSIKSIDATAPSYRAASAFLRELSGHARDMAQFNGAQWAGIRVPPVGETIRKRVLIVAFEDGALTTNQANTLAEFARRAKSTWPNLDVILTFMP
jgi:RHS repeat-associated protein